MQFLTILTATDASPAPSALDNALTLGIVAVLAIIVIVLVIRKAIANSRASKAVAVEVVEEAAPAAQAPTAPGTAGELKLHDVDPKTAAMLMAIVADKLGKPLNELRFISVKEVK